MLPLSQSLTQSQVLREEVQHDSTISCREGYSEDAAVGGITAEPLSVRSLSNIIDVQSLPHLQPFDEPNTILLSERSFTVAVSAIDRDLYAEFRRAEDNVTQDHSRSNDEQEAIAEQLHALFAQHRDEAAACVRLAEDGKGLQCTAS